MKKKAKAKKVKKLQKPKKSGEIFVSKNQLDAVEQKLTSQLTSLRLEVKAGFTSIDARFVSLEASMDSKFASMDAKLSGMLALMEEQNARNRFVLDGYTSVHDKQLSTEKRVENLEAKVFGKEQK